MLVVAIPKSASTALLTTLGEVHGLPRKQTVYPGNPWPRGYSTLAGWHSDAREITSEQVAEFTSADRIFKQHLPPTRENLRRLRHVPKVVLLRDPLEVVRAYRRAHVGELPRSKRRQFVGFEEQPEDAWIERADAVGVLDELERFAKRWRRVRGALRITYEDVVNDTDAVFDAIEDYFGLSRSQRPVVLSKERYSRA